jgi:hypothetical protein
MPSVWSATPGYLLAAALSAPAAALGAQPSAEREAAPADRAAAELSAILGFSGAYFSEENHHQTGAHDPAETGFNFQYLELAVSSAVDPYFRLDGHLVVGPAGVDLEELYGTTTALPARLQARFGKIASRFGRINALHPHQWNFADQPFALGRVFGGEGNRALGVELSWLAPLPWWIELSLAAMDASGEQSARSFLDGDNPVLRGPEDLLYVTAVKQLFPLTDDWSLLWGLSGAFGPNNSRLDARTDLFGTDIQLELRPVGSERSAIVSLQTEVFYRRRQIPPDLVWDVSTHTELFWRFAQRWGAAARYEYGSPPFVEGGGTPLDPLDPAWSDSRHRLSASFSHRPSELSRLRLQGSRDLPGWANPIWAVFLSAELAVGAHGAHTF